jgi:hypothetical protein
MTRITADDYYKLAEIGVLGDKIELDEGRVITGWDPERERPWELCFSPAQARAAAAHGITGLFSAVDAVAEDPQALAELRARLGEPS